MYFLLPKKSIVLLSKINLNTLDRIYVAWWYENQNWNYFLINFFNSYFFSPKKVTDLSGLFLTPSVHFRTLQDQIFSFTAPFSALHKYNIPLQHPTRILFSPSWRPYRNIRFPSGPYTSYSTAAQPYKIIPTTNPTVQLYRASPTQNWINPSLQTLQHALQHNLPHKPYDTQQH